MCPRMATTSSHLVLLSLALRLRKSRIQMAVLCQAHFYPFRVPSWARMGGVWWHGAVQVPHLDITLGKVSCCAVGQHKAGSCSVPAGSPTRNLELKQGTPECAAAQLHCAKPHSEAFIARSEGLCGMTWPYGCPVWQLPNSGTGEHTKKENSPMLITPNTPPPLNRSGALIPLRNNCAIKKVGCPCIKGMGMEEKLAQ